MTSVRRTPFPGARLWLVLLLIVCALPVRARADEPENRLRRIRIVPHAGFTRINLYFQDPPDYRVTRLDGRVRLEVRGADTPYFKKLRSYSDPRISGVFCANREAGAVVTVAVREPDPAVHAVSPTDPTVLSLDIGHALKRVQLPDIAPGREPILSGTERFVREYGVPARAGLPFQPSDVKELKTLMGEGDAALFQQGEGLLYRERGEEAMAVFSNFLGAGRPQAVRALAWFRLGEALTLMEKNDEALAAFRQGEALAPAFLDAAPRIMQLYAEVRAKNGDFAGGRALLVRLIDRLSGTVYAAQLMNRLADLSERHGGAAQALAMYRSVAAHAPGTPAAARALMKIADREMFTLSRERYPSLAARYRAIYEAPGDFSLRDEALFKTALVQALYGPAAEALQASVSYDTRYPRGIFSTIVKKMREELLVPVYRDLAAAGNQAGLARLALENREYLARCFREPEFAERLARAFAGARMLTQELELFGYLADRNWAASAAAFLAARAVEDALALGRVAQAESSGRAFLARFPADPRGQRVAELLARIAFEKGDLAAVAAQLRPLAASGRAPALPETDYYLGKALDAQGDRRGAERSLARFVKGAEAGSPLLSDARFALGGARFALKNYAGALAAYREGAQAAAGEGADQFDYKIGELYLRLGLVREATKSWEKVAGRGGSGTWAKLASQSLDDIRWRLKISRELP